MGPFPFSREGWEGEAEGRRPAEIARFVYDGDGNRVKATINDVDTYFVGNIYEVTGSQVTKYYYAGRQPHCDASREW